MPDRREFLGAVAGVAAAPLVGFAGVPCFFDHGWGEIPVQCIDIGAPVEELRKLKAWVSGRELNLLLAWAGSRWHVIDAIGADQKEIGVKLVIDSRATYDDIAQFTEIDFR